MKKILNKKIIILLSTLICVIVLSSILFINRKNIRRLVLQRLAENENEVIDITVNVKDSTDTERKCLVTLIANNDDEKIKSVEYPSQNGETPYVVECAGEGKKKVGIDYIIEKGKEDTKFKVTTVSGNVYEMTTKYIVTYDTNGGDEINKTTVGLKGENVKLETYATRDGYTFLGWAKNKDAIEPEINALYDLTYHYTQGDENIKLYAVWKEGDGLTGKDIIDAAAKINKTKETTLYIYTNEYLCDAIYYDGNLTLDGTTQVSGATLSNNIYEFGDKTKDVATSSSDAQKTVILKVNGNLTINSGVTLTACKSDDGYGGPKGMFIYCTGKITNNGTISMTARGARATGQDVVLWKNNDGSYEIVPADGANGADGLWSPYYGTFGGYTGKPASTTNFKRATGGGGSGAANQGNSRHGVSGAGGKGSSFSGGTGGGAVSVSMTSVGDNILGGTGNSNGGTGGYGWSNRSAVGGGAGNPGGSGNTYGSNGTGGLLIIYANELINSNNSIINANGSSGGWTEVCGGSSGGGSVNIFYRQNFENNGSIVANGGTAGNGGAGGTGSVTIGNISTGSFVEDE